MNNNKLGKIGKKELLEILLVQAKRIEELETELTLTKNKLEEKEIAISESNTLAEAVLKINGVFESLQLAIEQYIFNIQEKYKKIEKLKNESLVKETIKKKNQRTITTNNNESSEYNNKVTNKNRKTIKGRPIKKI